MKYLMVVSLLVLAACSLAGKSALNSSYYSSYKNAVSAKQPNELVNTYWCKSAKPDMLKTLAMESSLAEDALDYSIMFTNQIKTVNTIQVIDSSCLLVTGQSASNELVFINIQYVNESNDWKICSLNISYDAKLAKRDCK